jgi:hypothetical protein
MKDCNKLINSGIITRYILTIIIIYILSRTIADNKYIYLILPIILTLLDEVDNIFFYDFTKLFHYQQIEKINNSCTKSFYYQSSDKICDTVSYLLISIFFKVDYLFLFFILYRVIGVILFYITKNSKWLIIFFDFAKEYLIYLFIFGENYFYIPYFIFFKICFEYYYHTKHNLNNYTLILS